MKPEKISFYIYSETPEDALALQDELYRFVDSRYRKGILVTSSRLLNALKSFGSSPLIDSFFNGK